MAVVLALEPNPAQAAILRQLIARVRGAELVLVDTKDAALLAIEQRVPALILTSPLIAPGDEADLLARLRALPNGDRVQTLCTPLFTASAPAVPAKAGILNRWRHAPPAQPHTDDALVFARAVAAYLPRVATSEAPRVTPAPPRPAPAPPPPAPARVAAARPVKVARVDPPRRARVKRPAIIRPLAIAAARATVRQSTQLARVGTACARTSIIWAAGAAGRAGARGLRVSAIVAANAWASPRMRSVFAACVVALTAGAPPRTTGNPMPPAVVEVRANFADTEILVDGAARGRAPLRFFLSPGPHVVTAHRLGKTKTIELYVSSGARVLESIEWPMPKPAGALRVTSTPAGARVTIDGRVHGVTPLTIDELKPGSHRVLLESRAGSVRTTATVANGETAVLDVPIFSGWIAVFAPVQLEIHEKDRLLGTSESGRIMIRPGRHTLLLTNRELGYESTHVVDVLPGAVEAISITEVP